MVTGLHQGGVELEQRFPAGKNDIAMFILDGLLLPDHRNMLRQVGSRGETAPRWAVGAYKIGIAKLAYRAISVIDSTTPQVAAGQSAKDGYPACLGSFSLNRPKTGFDVIGHLAFLMACGGLVGVGLSRCWLPSSGDSIQGKAWIRKRSSR